MMSPCRTPPPNASLPRRVRCSGALANARWRRTLATPPTPWTSTPTASALRSSPRLPRRQTRLQQRQPPPPPRPTAAETKSWTGTSARWPSPMLPTVSLRVRHTPTARLPNLCARTSLARCCCLLFLSSPFALALCTEMEVEEEAASDEDDDVQFAGRTGQLALSDFPHGQQRKRHAEPKPRALASCVLSRSPRVRPRPSCCPPRASSLPQPARTA